MKRYIQKLLMIMAIILMSFFPASEAFALEQVKSEIDDHTVRIDYVDENKQIVNHPKQGYATIIRTLDEQGRAKTDFYFDTNGVAVPGTIGQYGVSRVYNDKNQAIEYRYLDAAGDLIVTKQGYSIMKRTYNEDGKADTDTYFGLDGQPVDTGRGVYGLRRIYQNGKVVKYVYIDRNGKDLFFLDRFFYKHPWMVFLAVLVMFAASLLLNRKGRLVLLGGYILVILYMTLYIRETGEPHSNLELFWSYRDILETGVQTAQVMNNIALFVPLGFLIGLLWPGKGWKVFRWGWLFPCLLSSGIEITQYITGTGLCELDDVFSNTLGGVIGYLAALAVSRWIGFKKEKTSGL